MLKGDLGFPPDAADMLAGVINRRIEVHSGAKSGSIGSPLRGGDLYLPLFEFAAKVIAAGGPISPDSLERAHRGLLDQLVPALPQGGQPLKLLVERFATDRSFEGFRGANEGPIEFEIGKHLGQISIEGDMIAQIKEPPLVYAWSPGTLRLQAGCGRDVSTTASCGCLRRSRRKSRGRGSISSGAHAPSPHPRPLSSHRHHRV